MFRGDADTVVLDLYHQEPSVRLDAHLNVPGFGELGSVAQQVGDDLAQSNRITSPMKVVCNRFIHVPPERHAIGVDKRLDRLSALLG